jgi:hypothetical protein
MAVSQSDIDALNAAIATGEKQVVLDGQSITYRSITDLREARNDLQEQLNRDAQIAAGKRKPKRVSLYYSGRGYN